MTLALLVVVESDCQFFAKNHHKFVLIVITVIEIVSSEFIGIVNLLSITEGCIIITIVLLSYSSTSRMSTFGAENG